MERSQTCPICRLAVFDEMGNVVQSTVPTTAEVTPTDEINVPETVVERSQEQIQDNQQQMGEGQVAVLDSWYSFPVEETSENLVTFSMKNSATNETVPASLLIERTNASERYDDDDDQVETIIIPDEVVDHAQTIENLKRRVSELESQVEHLNKRVRKD